MHIIVIFKSKIRHQIFKTKIQLSPPKNKTEFLFLLKSYKSE